MQGISLKVNGKTLRFGCRRCVSSLLLFKAITSRVLLLCTETVDVLTQWICIFYHHAPSVHIADENTAKERAGIEGRLISLRRRQNHLNIIHLHQCDHIKIELAHSKSECICNHFDHSLEPWGAAQNLI